MKRENRVVDIFDEVEEDLRAERATRLLKKYAWVLITLALAVVGAAIGWQLWTRGQTKQQMAASQHYLDAQTAAEAATASSRPDAIAALDRLAATAPEGYRTLSRLRAAGLKADAGDLAGAVALWDQVAGDGAADPLLRDVASLMVAAHQIDHGDPAQLEARLKPLAAAANPFSTLAREQLALLDLRQGKLADATAALKALSADFMAPAGLRQRAAAMVAGLGGGVTGSAGTGSAVTGSAVTGSGGTSGE